LHGFNDYSNAFEVPAQALAWRGIATYAYDQRGFGEAPLRGR
jgi:alpha-beta hydrolase superfamily lysophospholipase